MEWENKIKTPDNINEDIIDEWESVMSLYTGHFLEGYNMLWIQSERFRLEQLWVKCASRIASYSKDTNNVEKAEKWFLKICEFKPEEASPHFELMILYENLGLGLLVNHQYTILNNVAKDLGIEVNYDIAKWYETRKK